MHSKNKIRKKQAFYFLFFIFIKINDLYITLIFIRIINPKIRQTVFCFLIERIF